MWFICSFIGQVDSQKERIKFPVKFQVVRNEVTGLSLRREKCKDYSKEDFDFAIGLLADSPYGYVSFLRMVDQICEEKVRSLSREYVLHCRPPSDLARDLILPPENEVVTALSQPALLAMKHMLNKL